MSSERNNKKVCLCCCGICGVLITIVIVVVLVVVPKMVQSNLDSAKFALNNVTMITCDSWEQPPFYAALLNNASMENPGPGKVTIHDYVVHLHAYMCEDKDGSMKGGPDCKKLGIHAKDTDIGNFTAPGNSLEKGNNIVTNQVRLNVNNATETNGGFIIPLMLAGPEILIFEAKSVDVSIPLLMGYTVKGLSLTKRMNCTYFTPDDHYADAVTSKECPKWGGKGDFPGIAVAMKCEVTTKEDMAESPVSKLSSAKFLAYARQFQKKLVAPLQPKATKTLPDAGLSAPAACTGSGDPPSNTPYCYGGGKLGEKVVVKVLTFADGKGTVDVTGSGIETISCLNKPFTKDGQRMTVDFSDCVKTIKVKGIDYCSDDDSIVVNAQVGPIPTTVPLTKMTCPSEDDSLVVL